MARPDDASKPDPPDPPGPPPEPSAEAAVPEAAAPEPTPGTAPKAPAPEGSTSAAGVVAAGILASRILGFVREAVKASFFGASALADVYTAAFRMPNVLQNLLGEGTLSAAFIPIYSRMLDEGREEEAGRFAGAIFGLLFAVVATVILLAMWGAPYLVALLTPGFIGDAVGDLPPLVDQIAAWLGEAPGEAGAVGGAAQVDRYTLTVRAVRIIFPMTGVLVLSAWALGVLNSHRRFFLPYFAPVFWNVAIITAMFVAAFYLVGEPGAWTPPEAMGLDGKTDVLFAAFFGALIGGVLQFAVQLPLVFRLMKGFRPTISTKVKGVGEALRATGPVMAGKGAAQFSSYIDQVLAALLAAGALGALSYAQALYLLPVSLFGMSVAASELPELSRLRGERESVFVARVNRSVRQIAFLTVPSVVGYFVFGFLIVMAVFGRGAFEVYDGWLAYAALGGYSLGLLATTIGRLLQNSFWALGDTKTPAKIAVARIIVSAVVALPLMWLLDRFAVYETVGLPPPDDPAEVLYFGAAGIALGGALGAFLEIALLRRALRHRIAGFDLPARALLTMFGLALAAALPAAGLWYLLRGWPNFVLGGLVVGLFGLAYLGLAYAAHLPELDAWLGRFTRRLRKR